MDYEKKYKEILAKARTYYKSTHLRNTLEALETLFPELKENENEKIRKAIISGMNALKDNCKKTFAGIPIKDCIAWLEKQDEKSIDVLDEEEREFADNIDSFRKEIDDSYQKGYNEGVRVTLEKQCEQKPAEVRTTGYWNVQDIEQKPADKVEPNFKVGDWVIDKQGIVHQIANVIENVTNRTYDYDIVGGGYFNDNTEGVRLWTIQDAKDGDVLAFNNNNIVIFKDLYNTTSFHSYCYIEDGIFFISKDEMPDWWVGEGFHPATKEQRDTLIKAMADAGYTFDFEKKELKKIEQKSQRMISAEAKETLYDKPAWSEEDEKVGKELMDFCIKCSQGHTVVNSQDDFTRWATWLKSLKDRVLSQPKQEWSEEDKQYFNFLEKLLICLQVKSTEGEIKKGTNSNSEYYYKVIQWLKSLRPQNYWKPSDEQMSALISILPVIRGSGDKVQNILETLYDDLKKLNEE